MNTEHATPELYAALAKAQAEVENASKNSANPHFKSKYADLAEVLNTVRPVLAKHGIAILQSTEFDGACVRVTTALCHASGGVVTSTAACVPAKTDAQGIGSATTYLRRYSLAAMCGVAQEDDDGNAAAHDSKPKPVTEAQRAKADEFAEAMRGASTDAELVKVGKDLAGSSLPSELKAALRALYSERHNELKEAA